MGGMSDDSDSTVFDNEPVRDERAAGSLQEMRKHFPHNRPEAIWNNNHHHHQGHPAAPFPHEHQRYSEAPLMYSRDGLPPRSESGGWYDRHSMSRLEVKPPGGGVWAAIQVLTLIFLVMVVAFLMGYGILRHKRRKGSKKQSKKANSDEYTISGFAYVPKP